MHQTQLTNAFSVINNEALQKSSGQTLDEVLNRVAGVESVSLGQVGAASSYFIRGGNSNHTLILVDGQRVSDIASGHSAIEHIPLHLIDRIEVARGSASSRFGSDAISGVIAISTKRGVGQPHLDAGLEMGNYGYLAQNAALSGEVNNTAFRIAAGHQYARGYNATTPDNRYSYHPDQDGYHNRHFQARMDHHLTEDHEFGASIYHHDAKIDIDNTHFLTPYHDSQIQQKMLNSRIYSKNQVFSWWNSEFWLGLSQNRIEQIDDQKTVLAAKTVQKQAQWTHHFTQGPHQFLAGLEWRDEILDSDAYPSNNRRTYSLFAAYQGAFEPHHLQINIRHDHSLPYQGQNTGNVDYRFAATQRLQLFAHIGCAFHNPTFMDLYYPGFNNPKLVPEKSNSVEIGTRYSITSRWTVNVSAWQNRIRDLIQYDSRTRQPENISSAKLTGASFATHAKWRTFTLQASVDLQNPVDHHGHLLSRRSKRVSRVSLEQEKERWSWRGEMHSTAYRYDSDHSRLGGYTLFHLSTEYRFNKAWGITAHINNLFDKRYVAMKGYASPRIHGVISVNYTGL